MRLQVNNIVIPLEEDGPDAYTYAAAQKMGVAVGDISVLEILGKALDLRDEQQFYYKMSLVIEIANSYANRQKFTIHTGNLPLPKKQIEFVKRPLIVGFGPAGMFAALELIAHGQRPIIFERGKTIEERSLDVEKFIKDRKLNPESNIQFGEGGAGSYSDGKLFSRRNNNTGTVNRVLTTFVKFGAPADIEYISKPHLGTDVLCDIVRNIRLFVLARGGDIHYSSRMTDILIRDGKASGIVINGEQEFFSSHIFLALGHSARDTVSMLHKRGVAMEQRKIAVGVRIEHPVQIINEMRYGRKYLDYPGLGAATYSLNHTNREIRRGVYTFCMCPGGEVVNAASGHGGLVLNGMSYSHRALPFSNGALVVSCHCSDYKSESPMGGFAFQEAIERKAYCAGGADWCAPAQNLMDFLGEGGTTQLGVSSYKMGLVAADMRDILPEFVTRELSVAFDKWREQVPLFVSHEAVLLAPETRTSSPVRLSRNEYFESINTENLYPIGEGAGYTGGITSSAADAIKAVAGLFGEAEKK